MFLFWNTKVANLILRDITAYFPSILLQVQRRGGHVERPIFHDHILRSLTGSSVWPFPMTDYRRQPWWSPSDSGSGSPKNPDHLPALVQSCLYVREGRALIFVSESQIKEKKKKKRNSLLIRFFRELLKHVECLLGTTCVNLSFFFSLSIAFSLSLSVLRHRTSLKSIKKY